MFENGKRGSGGKKIRTQKLIFTKKFAMFFCHQRRLRPKNGLRPVILCYRAKQISFCTLPVGPRPKIVLPAWIAGKKIWDWTNWKGEIITRQQAEIAKELFARME